MSEWMSECVIRVNQLMTGSPEIYTGELENLKELLNLYDETYNEVK